MKFIFTIQNRKLKQLCEEWKAGNCYGVYLLYGPSYCGKSTLLNDLFSHNNDVLYLECYELLEMYINQLKKGIPFDLSPTPIMIVENIDCLYKLPSLRDIVIGLIKEWAYDEANRRLIICTARNASIAQAIDDVFTPIEVKPLKVNRRVVCTIAEGRGIHLTNSQIRTLAKSKNPTELNIAINKLIFKTK